MITFLYTSHVVEKLNELKLKVSSSHVMHHPKETLLIDSSNPSYSHLTEYRFDNLKREESRSTSLFGDRRRVMKILSGFSLIIIVVFIFATSHEQVALLNISQFLKIKFSGALYHWRPHFGNLS